MENLVEQIFHQIRQNAISWWCNLNPEEQISLLEYYFPERDSQSLTGREIEIIYKKEEFLNEETL